MKRIIVIFISLLFAVFAFAQTPVKKVAILETVDKMGDVSYGVLFQVRSSLTHAISSSPGYEGYDRVDMASIMGEHNFQRTGMVSDSQIKQLGQMTGAAYVLIAEAANYGAQHIIIAAKILDVEKGGVIASTPPSIADKDPMKMAEACKKICASLVGGSAGHTYTYSSHPASTQSSNASYGSPAPNRQNQTITVNGVSFTMVYVEGGSFMMGCTSEQSGCESDESPSHRVMLNSFYMGETEVTQELWRAVMGDNPSQFKGDKLPVEMVSWDDCELFVKFLNRMTGKHFRLPTEAEWEYAARGGRKSESNMYAGANSLSYVGWYDGNAGGSTHVVKGKLPNELGLYDMSGNVWEWCQDWYSSSYYASSPTDNPKNLSSGSYRVLRGGSWGNDATYCRVASRDDDTPGSRYSGSGFRLVLVQD